MATGVYLSNKLRTTNGNITIPNPTAPNTVLSEPFTLGSGYVLSLNETYNGDEVVFNSNSYNTPLFLKVNGTVKTEWSSLPNDSVWRKIVEFSDGQYIGGRRYGSTGLQFGFYNSQGSAYFTGDISNVLESDNLKYVCISFLLTSDDKYLPVYCMGWKSSGTTYRLTITSYPQSIGVLTSGSIAPTYTWQAWDQIAGYHGQYICNLTKIKNDEIGDISGLVQSSDTGVFTRLSPESNIWDIYRNMPLDTDVTIAWSGVGYLMLRVSNVQDYDGWKDFTFKFFYREAFANVPFYTYTVRISVGVGGGDVRACYLVFVYDAEEGVAAFTPVFHTESNYFWGTVSNTAEEMGHLFMWLALSGSPEAQKPYDTGTEDDGGNPSGVKPQDHIGSPASPILDAAGSGLFTVYCPTDTELAHIADYLWDNDIIENMHKYFNNFSDNIISLYVLPYKPSNNLTKVFQVGNLQSSDSALAAVEYLSGRFAKIDMGEYTITPFWDSYLDYSPYTKLEIYLPGVGIQSLDPDDIMCPTNDDGTLPSAAGSTISLEYMIDLMTGILVAYVKVNSEVRYQFPGKVGYQIPLTGENYTRLMTGFVSATAGLIGTIATGGTAAPFAAAASTAGIINAMKPDTYRGGNLSGDASMLSGRTPFLIYRRPNKPRLTDQDKFTGFPSYKIDILSNFSGYTEVVDCHVEGISCTDEEREKILAALKGGVII